MGKSDTRRQKDVVWWGMFFFSGNESKDVGQLLQVNRTSHHWWDSLPKASTFIESTSKELQLTSVLTHSTPMRHKIAVQPCHQSVAPLPRHRRWCGRPALQILQQGQQHLVSRQQSDIPSELNPKSCPKADVVYMHARCVPSSIVLQSSSC